MVNRRVRTSDHRLIFEPNKVSFHLSKWEGNVGVGSMRFQQCQLLIASRRQVRDQVLLGLARYLGVVEALDDGEAQGDPLST